MTLKLSPSSINLMLECPRCFWLQIVKKIKRPESIFPSLPSGMDKILKEHFDRFMEKNELPPEIKEHVKDCKLFNDKEKLKIWRNNLKGIEYKDEENDILLHGAVDNLLVKGKKLIVLDYKTRGFPLKEDTHEHYQVQLDLYNFLLRKNNYETEDYSYLLFYYPNKVLETGEVIFDTRLIKMKTSSLDGEKIFKEAVRVIKNNMPEAGKECGFCRRINENGP
ncbi:PD-(D/E)XK nuclease family protein [Candidatus Woesearchaeota archaeon]|nr:PD-(D/E)XK nuclease family protein [Candidatus Woesearchaeota archaeon]